MTIEIDGFTRVAPSANCLLWIEDSHRFMNPSFLDQDFSAELPDPSSDPDGSMTHYVKEFMVHHRSGLFNPNSLCLELKPGAEPPSYQGFPKPFREETKTQAGECPQFRRRERVYGQPIRWGNNEEYNNQWVYPYSPVLLSMWQTHVNVDVVASVPLSKYIHRYITQQADVPTYMVHNDNRFSTVRHFTSETARN